MDTISNTPLDWRNHEMFLGIAGGSHDTARAQERSRWPIPNRETMNERWAFRQSIREETLQHRRIHRHGGMGETGRNIAFVLRDRELRGATGTTLRNRPIDRTQSVASSDAKRPRDPNSREDEGVNGLTKDTAGRNPRPPSNKRVCYPTRISHEVQLFAEYCSVIRYHSAFFRHLGGDDEPGERGERPSSSKATLEGHPRTPWTVKYHPSDSAMLASGCLGHQVRLWHWPDKVCLQMIRLEFAIISLSFHPTGNLLAVANGTRLHFWGYNQNSQSNSGNNERPGAPAARSSRGILTEVDQRHMLRCVHFPPEGNSIIIGGVNPTTDDPRRRNRGGIGGGGMSFYLRLWDFDISAALQTFDDASGPMGARRRAIGNPRTFVPRALLYNDGGFDVSPDGKMLCACAEYWLPEGVNNAMEMLQGADDDDDDNVFGEDGDGGNELPRSERDRTGASTPTLPDSKDGEEAALSTPPASNQGSARFSTPIRQSTPNNSAVSNAPSLDIAPQTPPRSSQPSLALSPPSPPGRRFSGGVGRSGANQPMTSNSSNSRIQPLLSTPTQNQQSGRPGPMPPPPPPPPGIASRPPHPLSIISGGGSYEDVMNKKGRYVPHVVTVSLDTTPLAEVGGTQRGMMKLTPVAKGYRPRLGQLLEASPLDGAKASAVTCVKFSPSTDFCLIGYGVREPVVEGGGQYHPVTALYRVRGGMTHVSTMLSGDDDVNIARFHPDSGYGFVYGTKQGRVRVLSPRPWNFYN